MTTTTRYYYAATHHYGIDFGNDFGTLYRFTTKTARDEWVDREQDSEIAFDGNMKTEDITSAAARRHFPVAFRHDVFDDSDCGWVRHDDGRLSYDIWPYCSATYSK